MSEAPSEDRLSEIETLCLAPWPMAYFSPIKSTEMRDWVKEIRRLREENSEFNKSLAKVAN